MEKTLRIRTPPSCKSFRQRGRENPAGEILRMMNFILAAILMWILYGPGTVE